jgi:hypothetical protein
LPRTTTLANLLAAVLLVATAAAFVVIETLKLEKSPLAGTRVTKVFSPVCGCATSRATIRFRSRRNDRVTVSVLDASGKIVRTLARSRPLRKGWVTFTWDGRNGAGRVVRNGLYRPFVDLLGTGRSFDIPNEMRVDTTPPHLTIVSARPRTISPNRDRRADKIRIPFRVNEPATTSLRVDGIRRVLLRGMPLAQKLEWTGRVHGRVLLGRHRLVVVSRDVAGNVTRSAPIVLVVRAR